MQDPAQIQFDDFDTGHVSWATILKQAQESGRVAADVPASIQERVRLEQIHALRTNIAILKQKQEEFNQRIDVYTGEIEKLVASLASLPKTQVESPPAPSLVVRCVGCGREREFPGFAVLRTFAPKDDFHSPTELWLETETGPRRGVFRCPECGPSTLAIRTRP